MATWNDKQLAGHKRAQSYISSAGATLGVAALGAASLKAKPMAGVMNRAATKLTARTGSKKMAGRLRSIPANGGRAAVPLTTGSAGVGGIGGYNFAAIQSQEAKRSRVNKSEGGMDFGTAGASGRNLELVEKRSYDPERNRNQRLEGYRNAAYVGGGIAAGAGGAAAVNSGRRALRGKKLSSVSVGRASRLLRPAGKAAAVSALGAGAIVAGDRIDAYRKTKARSYKPLRG